jgi:hypothetical protein
MQQPQTMELTVSTAFLPGTVITLDLALLLNDAASEMVALMLSAIMKETMPGITTVRGNR